MESNQLDELNKYKNHVKNLEIYRAFTYLQEFLAQEEPRESKTESPIDRWAKIELRNYIIIYFSSVFFFIFLDRLLSIFISVHFLSDSFYDFGTVILFTSGFIIITIRAFWKQLKHDISKTKFLDLSPVNLDYYQNSAVDFIQKNSIRDKETLDSLEEKLDFYKNINSLKNITDEFYYVFAFLGLCMITLSDNFFSIEFLLKNIPLLVFILALLVNLFKLYFRNLENRRQIAYSKCLLLIRTAKHILDV